MSAPKCAESIPAVTAPVKLPKLRPSDVSYRVGVITGGVLAVLTVVLAIVAAVTL